MGRLVSLAALPAAFTLIPLYRLQVHSPSTDLQLVVDLVAAAGVAAFVAWPRRYAWALVLTIGLAYSAVSLSAGRVVASQAAFVKKTTLGDTRDWIDRATPRPVTFLYSGEALFSTVWENMFWNKRIDRVYGLEGSQVFGLDLDMQPSVDPDRKGDLVVAQSGRPATADDVVAPTRAQVVGDQLTYAYGPALILWRTRRPFRLSSLRRDVLRADRTLQHMRFVVYSCRGGTLRVTGFSPVAQRVDVTTGGRTTSVGLGAGEQWHPRIPVRGSARSGHATCTVFVRPQVDLVIQDTRFVRAP